MDISTLIQEHPLYSVIALSFSVVPLAITSFKQVITCYEDYVVSRNIKRLDKLSGILNDQSVVKGYLNSLEENEIMLD